MTGKRFHPSGRCRFLFVLFLAVAVAWPASGVRADGDILRIRLVQAPTTLIPHLSSGYKDRFPNRLVYEPLASHDAAGNLVPVLADEIPSRSNGGLASDGRSVVWKLKPGVRWSDGAPLTAADVCFTFAFVTDPAVDAYSAVYYDAVESVTVVDDLTVRVRFKTPNPLWAQPFVGDIGVILPRHVFEVHTGERIHRAPQSLVAAGTGPFRLKTFGKEEMLLIGDDLVNMVRIVFEANPRFRETGKPHFSGVEIRGGGDVRSAARAVMVEGSADFASNLVHLKPEAFAEMAGENAKGRFVFLPDQNVERIVLNFSDPGCAADFSDAGSVPPHPFFSDKRVRQAFAHAVDRGTVAALYGGTAVPATDVLVAPEKYKSPHTAAMYPFDLARAAELLDAAGWRDTDGDGVREKNGAKLRVTYQTSVSPVRQEIQKRVKQDLEAVGVSVHLKFIDPSVFFNNDPANPNSLVRFNADMQEYSFGNALPDPTGYLGMWRFRGDSASVWERWRWFNDKYDAIGRRLETEFDPEKRREMFIRMNDMLVEEVALIPLVNPRQVCAVGRLLENAAFTLWDRETWQIKDWRRKPL